MLKKDIYSLSQDSRNMIYAILTLYTDNTDFSIEKAFFISIQKTG